jgi:dipeptidyl aminopeptidase/acylaminoacyl peptidase
MRVHARYVLAAILASLVVAGPAAATFPGDNGRISFHRFGPDEGPPSLFTVRPDGFGLRPLSAFGPDAVAVFSDWAPDGERLAIDSDASGSPQVWLINPDGTGARRLTDSPAFAVDPGWTPDGRRLAVEADFGDGPGIFLIPARTRHGALVTGDHAKRVTRPADGGFDTECSRTSARSAAPRTCSRTARRGSSACAPTAGSSSS